MKTGRLVITLKSDLCVGSGFSYGGSVDSDIVYDAYGFPYIPAKRIKGCFRDAAVMLGWKAEVIERIFGVRGAEAETDIKIGNATLELAEDHSKEINSLTAEEKALLSPQNILAFYTSTRSQTSIDERSHIAKDDSLRFTRVINHYKPDFLNENPEEQVFVSQITYKDEADEKCLEMLAKATRNIGMNRTRGMGSVKMVFVPSTEKTTAGSVSVDDCEGYKRISYCLTNVEPLMVSMETDDSSASYINGSSVLGVLAREYLKMAGHSAEDEFFRKVFLSESAVFSNLTLAAYQDNSYRYSAPVPAYINELKKSKVIVNLLAADKNIPEDCEEEKRWIYESQNGNQPKKFKNKYMLEEDGKICILDPEYDIEYHHRKKKADEDEQLFFFEVLAKGQFFAGEILVEEKYYNELKSLIQEARWVFGKSRSAQYGLCKLVKGTPVRTADTKVYKQNDRVVVTFQSDAYFCDEEGNYIINSDTLQEKIADELGLKATGEAYLQTKVLTGYMSVWNMQKEQIPAIAAGSAIVFEVTDAAWKPGRNYIGERTVEGLGKISIQSQEDMKYILDREEETKSDKKKAMSASLKKMYDALQTREYVKKIIDAASIHSGSMTASHIGRLTLMLVEAQNSKDDTFIDFERRVSSIKKDAVKKTSISFVQKYLGKDFKDVSKRSENNRVPSVHELENEYTYDHKTVVEQLLKTAGINDQNYNKEMLYNMWPECMMAVLTKMKYAKKD